MIARAAMFPRDVVEIASLANREFINEAHSMSKLRLELNNDYARYYDRYEKYKSTIAAINEYFKNGLSIIDHKIIELVDHLPGELHGEVHLQQGYLYRRSNRSSEAIEEFKAACALHPFPIREGLALAETYYLVEKFFDAIIFADFVIDLDNVRDDTPFIDSARCIKAMSLIKLNLIQQARVVIALCPEDIYFNLGGQHYEYKDILKLVE